MEQSSTGKPVTSAPMEQSSTGKPFTSAPIEQSYTSKPVTSAPMEQSSTGKPFYFSSNGTIFYNLQVNQSLQLQGLPDKLTF